MAAIEKKQMMRKKIDAALDIFKVSSLLSIKIPGIDCKNHAGFTNYTIKTLK
jgi:hypothetical protein